MSLPFSIRGYNHLLNPSFNKLRARLCKDTTALPSFYLSCQYLNNPSNYHAEFCSTLVALHRHELKHSGASLEALSVAAPAKPILALQILSRMFHDMTSNLHLSEDEALNVPCFQIHTLYLSLWLHIIVGNRNNEGYAQGLRKELTYLRIVKRKWRLAGKSPRIVLEMIHSLICSLFSRGT
jgi:hypothetical protein